MIKVYGIPNCDTVKKTLNWFKANRIPFEFHDYKKEGITATHLKEWSRQVGWEVLLNKRGTTYKELDPETQATINNEKAAIKIMAAHTSSIKRPVIERDGKVLAVGFDAKKYPELIS